jgi:Abortive infection alpha
MSELEPKDVLEAGAKALFGPVQELFLKLTEPAVEEYGLMWAESVRMRRMKRFVNGLAKTKRMLEDAGFDPQIVPDKLLLPIFEGMSLEENEDLHTMWAALLANAASPAHARKVRPGFIAILKQMAPDEAALLKWTHAKSQGWTPYVGGLKWIEAQAELGFTSKEEADRSHRIDPRMATCLDGLEAQQLIRRTYFLPSSSSSLDAPRKNDLQQVNSHLTLTERGRAFIEACRPPKPKS